jgi:NADH-quinone oxidoreductase subunit M
VAATGVVLGAVYMLYVVKRVFFGKITRESNKHLADLNGREITVLAPLVIMVFVMGIMPKPFFDKMEPAVKEFVTRSSVAKVAPVAQAKQPEAPDKAGAKK